MAIRCHSDFPIGSLVDQSSCSLHPDPQGSMRFQAVELSPIVFRLGRGGMMVACVAWVAWR